ncbi:MAG: hypothetical protein KAV41_00595 [Candidatus Pacebacteria bacterium]|nr:hypothetical protein [Candidatus Paceibacterota bacterium]
MKTHKEKQYFYTYAFGLIAILLLLLGLFYRHNQYGDLRINSLDDNLSIFIDNKKIVSEQDINLSFKLKNGEHSIVISKENFWPWIKNVEIKRKTLNEISPFFIPQNTSGFLIGESDLEYANILSRFEKNLISAEALNKITNANLELKSKIKAIDFYKNRKDVVLVALPDGIYALETENKNIQNFQPIYKGQNPLFVKKDDKSIYVLDDNNLMLVNY